MSAFNLSQLTAEQQAIVKPLANEFASILRLWISPADLAVVIRLNDEDAEHICHAHDFCDANQAMIDAFISILRREPHVQSDEDNMYINTAWALAKSNKFQPTL